MDNQERQVISDIFKRLEQVADQPRDPETERFIAEKIRQQSYAPYAMAQAIYVQEQALVNLQQRLEQLEGELEDLRNRRQSGGGLLGSLFGGGAREPEQPRRPTGGPFGQPQYGADPRMGGQPGGPWGGGQPGMMGGGQPGLFQRGGSGFLGTAMMTAAGVAGGMMLGNALSSAFGGSKDAAGGQSLFGGGEGAQANAGDHSNLSPFQDSGSGSGSGSAAFQDASYEPGEDFGGDGGDWT